MTHRRSTKQRDAVAAALHRSEGFRSAQDLHTSILQSGESIGLATVYRNLTWLADSGDIDHLVSDEGESLYRECSAGHHHHLVCRTCGATKEVEGQGVEAWAADIGRQHGFTDISHTVELAGLCADCAAA